MSPHLLWRLFASLMLMLAVTACGSGRTPPELSATALVDNVAQGSALRDGDTLTLDIRSGQSVAVNGALEVLFSASLGSAQASGLTVSDTGWTARLSSDVATQVKLLVTLRDDVAQQATVLVNITPTPLSAEVRLAGLNLTPERLQEGGVLEVDVASGQTLALQTSVPVDVSETLGDARASQRASAGTLWSAVLSSAVNARATLVVAARGDTSRSLTVNLNVKPTPLQVQVKVAGALVNSAPVLAGETYAVSLRSGQTLQLDSSVPMLIQTTLNGASLSNVNKTSTQWLATLAGAAATDMTVVLVSQADATLMATFQVHIDPNPLALTLSLDGSTVGTPVADGETRVVDLRAGQTLAVNANMRIDVTEALAGARASNRVRNATLWQATLSADATTEALLTLNPSGDTSRVATLRLRIAPTPLSLAVRVDGTATGTNPLLAGETSAIALKSGQTLSLEASVPVQVEETLDIARKSAYVRTSTSWSAALSASAPTTVTLVVKATADASVLATVQVSLDQAPLTATASLLQDNLEVWSEALTVGSALAPTQVLQSGDRIKVVAPASQPIDVSPALDSGVSLKNLSVQANAWTAQVFSQQTGAVTLTVSPQGASGRSGTVRYSIGAPTLLVDLTVAGVAQDTPLTEAAVLSFDLRSGQGLSLVARDNSSAGAAFVVSETLNGAVLTPITRTARSYAASFTASVDTQVVLTVTAISDSTRTATVLLNIKP